MDFKLSNELLMRSSAFASIFVASILIILKIIAFSQTGSLGVEVSLLDSVLDALASIVNLYAIHKSLQPPTQEYRFGFGKAEALSGLVQSALIFGSTSWLLIKSIKYFINPVQINVSVTALYFMVIASVLTIFLIMWQRYVLRRVKSLAVAADNVHYETDLYLNIGTFFALLFTSYLGFFWIDTLFALSAVLLIMYKTWPIAKESFDVLMDKELPHEVRTQIKLIALSHPHVKGIHELRTRSSGNFEVIQFHIVLDTDLTLNKAHIIAHEVEDAVIHAFPKAQVIIHQDPFEDEHDPHGLCSAGHAFMRV